MRSLKFVALVFVSFLFTYKMNAQISVGVKIGANFADTRVSGVLGTFAPEQKVYTGFTAGIIAEIPMTSAISFRPELNFIQKGFQIRESFDVSVIGLDLPLGGSARTRLNYIEVPLLIKYSIGSEQAKFYAIAGPNVAYAANAELRPRATFIVDFNLPHIPINLDNDLYNRWEVSGVIGLGGEVKAGQGKIFMDGRYNLGFTSMLENPIVNLDIKNQGFNISAGYAYTF